MAILVLPRWLDFCWQARRLQMCLKFCMVKVANCTVPMTGRKLRTLEPLAFDE
jgi:hypothetical protein